MKYTLGVLWQLLVITMLFSGSVFADSPTTLCPGEVTPLNGKAVYFSVMLGPEYQLQASDTASAITISAVELKVSPNTTAVIGEPPILVRGPIVGTSGKSEIGEGKSALPFATGETAQFASLPSDDTLPDAPSAVQSEREPHTTKQLRRKAQSAPPAATVPLIDFRVANWTYFAVNGAMLGSSILSVHLTHTCLQAKACDFLPDAFHRRLVMYGVGLPAVVGVSYLGYYLKTKSHRWWFVPAALVTAGDIVVSIHAAHYSH